MCTSVTAGSLLREEELLAGLQPETPKEVGFSEDQELCPIMISIPTVLILGAGASHDYGFHCGEELKQRVLSGLSSVVSHSQFPSNADGRILHDLGFTQTEIRDFLSAFNFSGTISIDAFLEHRSEDLVRLGKTVIALYLCPLEDLGELFRKVNGRQDWYQYLYNRMNTTWIRPQEPNKDNELFQEGGSGSI